MGLLRAFRAAAIGVDDLAVGVNATQSACRYRLSAFIGRDDAGIEVAENQALSP